MRFLTLIAALACAGANLAPQVAMSARPQAGATAPSAEADLLKACNARLRALNRFDLAALDRYTHRDYVGTEINGARVSKDQLLKTYAAHSREPPNTYGPMEELQEHVYGNTGILNYRIELRERYGERDLVTVLRRTDVFVMEEGRWQAVSTSLTDIPVSHLTPATVDAAHYDDYVGEYQLSPDNLDSVTREGQTLVRDVGGGKAELLPLGDDRFFARDDAGQVSFTRDAAGQVTGYSYLRCDGQKIIARRVR